MRSTGWMLVVVGCAGGDVAVEGLEVGRADGSDDPVAIGEVVALTATASLADGSAGDVTAEVAWTSSDDGVLTVDGTSVTGVAVGSAELTATYEDVSATLALDVVDEGPYDVVVSGDWSRQHGNGTFDYYVRVVDDGGNVATCGMVTSSDGLWSYSAPDVLVAHHLYHGEAFADVNADGLANDGGHRYMSDPAVKAEGDLAFEIAHGPNPFGTWTDVPCP